mmetsp:Transcript_1894/g.1791  ORF Transcript_1894/g.1791 Transcript_1894/m.1791 type:complete len:221 (+) Transcript_1894:62-724(+)
MSSIAKVHYYPAAGKANQIRLALAASGIPFEDKFAFSFPPSPEKRAEWIKLGGNTTTNVPMLQMDDKVYTQSAAVLRAVGRKGGLMPEGADDLYMTDKLIDDAEDLRQASYKCMISWGASQELADAYIAEVLPKHLGNLERQLKASEGIFFLGDKLTIADIAVYDVVARFCCDREPTALDEFAALKKFKEDVESNEGIAKYHASDQYAAIAKLTPASLGK